MTKYRYSALDPSGATVAGVESAASVRAVHAVLIARGLQPTMVRPKTSMARVEIIKRRVPPVSLADFSRQMAVLLKAGVPILESLDIVAEQTPSALMESVIQQVIASLHAGDTFAEAVAAHPEAFPNFYVGVLTSAELTGNLDAVMLQLAAYIGRDQRARRKISAALVYPAIVAVMGLATIVVLAGFVLPRFVVFFQSLNAKLPLPTRMLMAFSAWATHWWPTLTVIAACCGVGYLLANKTRKGRAVLDRTLLRVPIVGEIMQMAILERTCRILGSLLAAGIDLPRALTVTAESANNYLYRKALGAARAEVMEGQQLAESIQRTGLFPGTAQQMFRVGEETGTLDHQLTTAAEYYAEELDIKITRATALFEPAMIVAVGVVVGFVAVALISAMYGIYNQVGPR
jgi:type IV pilus assembly protein PilC